MTDRSVPRRPMPAQPIPGARRRLAPAPRRSAWHSIAGYAALAAACVVLAAVTFLVVAAPTDFIRDQLVREVKQRTGRELAIAGPVSARFFPSPGVRLADVTISGPEDSGASLATVKSVDVEVSAWSFLSRRVEARRVILREPVIDLAAITRTRREGVGAAQEAGRPAQPLEGRAANAGAVPGLPAINPKVAASLDRLGLGRLRIVNGTVKYQDAKTGTSQQIGALDLDVSLKGPDAPLLATGSGVWRGEKIAIEASLGSLRGFILGERTPARIALSGQPLAVRYVGTLTAGGAVDGRIEVAAPSQAALQAWLGTSRGLAGPEPVSLSATLAGTAERLSVTGLDAAAGTLTAQGDVTIATGGERPRVEGRLHLSELDFGNILLRRDGAVAPLPRPMRPAGEALPVPTQTTEERRPQATADPGKRLGGRDWSDQAFDVALLGLADAELQLSVDRLAYRDVQTGPARLAVALKDKVATVTLQNMQLYGGQGRGVLTLHGTGDALASE
ncbi:MAG TPA: AsmA family protein, partial [Hyphomicrobiaceae bacterium]|nr:AsmA family protein [Hyphomicrobiaceae bacterium]